MGMGIWAGTLPTPLLPAAPDLASLASFILMWPLTPFDPEYT